MRISNQIARAAVEQRTLAPAKVLEVNLPGIQGRRQRTWILRLTDHALHRARVREISGADIFAAIWLGSSLRVRGDEQNPFRVSYLFQNMVVITSKPPEDAAQFEWSEEWLPPEHILNDPARRRPWRDQRILSLHSIITTYRRDEQ